MALHLLADDRKVVVATLITLDAADRLLGTVAPPDDATADLLVRGALNTARAIAGNPAQSVDAFLQQWTALVLAQRQGLPLSAGAAAVDAFVGDVGQNALGLSCLKCPGAGTALCDAAWSGDPAEGICLHPLQALFKYAVSSARSVYAAAGIPLGTLEAVELELSTVPAAKNALRIVPDIGVSGLCNFVGSSGTAAEVELQIPLWDLNIDGMNATLYVLLHEILVHGFQRLGATKRQTSHLDPFSEGWMDVLALRVYQENMARFDPGAAPSAAWLRDAAPGFALWKGRAGTVAGLSPHVRFGRDVAQRLWWAIGQLTNSPGEELFRQLSCGINVRDVSLQQRMHLVHALSRHLPNVGDRSVPRTNPSVIAVANFIQSKDIVQFISQGSGLP